ncbi:hypothetical protein [[Phormidium] sp. ETS-05]|uniref:hypothetical protein n=1 Tax=[Phormidium] sp. ETS-05 TaxID=222819 RepID=UPI0018EEEC8D|nr:hypothetical protein [[Phormidium] sp. ETS-05]
MLLLAFSVQKRALPFGGAGAGVGPHIPVSGFAFGGKEGAIASSFPTGSSPRLVSLSQF